MQPIPQVQLKSKANTLLINYAENEMPRFPASLAGRHRACIPLAPPAPLRTDSSSSRFRPRLSCTHCPSCLGADLREPRQHATGDQAQQFCRCLTALLSPGVLPPTFSYTRGRGLDSVLLWGNLHWFCFHRCLPSVRGIVLIGRDL